MPASVRRIPSLDGIRAASFMLVFAGHAGVPYSRPDLGVTIFFFLSGFIITTLLRSEFERTASINVWHFWLRRALRIVPPLYISVLLGVVLLRALYPERSVTASTVVAELLFYANYWDIYVTNDIPPGTGVVWSLAVEEHFYLLFPWAYIAMRKWGLAGLRQAQLLWGACAAVLIWRCILIFVMHVSDTRIYPATDTRLDSILFGCALAVWNNPVLDPPTGSPTRWKYLLLPMALAALSLCYWWSIRHFPFRNTVYYSIQGVALTIVFTGAIRFHDWSVFRLLNLKPAAFLGVLSYSLYLIHQVLLEAAAQIWPHRYRELRVTIVLAVCVAVAYLLYVLVERPCAQLRQKLTHQ